MTSFATVTPGNMALGPCRVKWNGVDLGGTLGNVNIKMKYDKANIMADQFGKSVLNRVNSGVEATVETELVEILNKDIWKVVFPNAIEVTSGGNKLMVWQSKVGSDDLSLAKALLLHPLSNADADLSADMTFSLALSNEDSQFVLGPTQQQLLKLVWNVYLDTSLQPAILFKRGDPSIGLIAAVAGTPAFTGTGNGTMTSVSTGSATKTETITATVLGIPAANKSNWEVHGSLSGPLGILQLTSGSPGGSGTFVSNALNFTITDGSTDFIVGDFFTVATTAANYV